MIYLYYLLGWLLLGVLAIIIGFWSTRYSHKNIEIKYFIVIILFGLISFICVSFESFKNLEVKNPFYKEDI